MSSGHEQHAEVLRVKPQQGRIVLRLGVGSWTSWAAAEVKVRVLADHFMAVVC